MKERPPGVNRFVDKPVPTSEVRNRQFETSTAGQFTSIVDSKHRMQIGARLTFYDALSAGGLASADR